MRVQVSYNVRKDIDVDRSVRTGPISAAGVDRPEPPLINLVSRQTYATQRATSCAQLRGPPDCVDLKMPTQNRTQDLPRQFYSF